MKEKDPLEPLLDQVAELLKKIQDYKEPISDIPPHVIEQLDRLEQAMFMFQQLNQAVANASNVNFAALRAELGQSKTQSIKSKQILARARRLEIDALQMQAFIAQIIAQKQTESTQIPKKNIARQMRKKFRSLGDKGWLPL